MKNKYKHLGIILAAGKGNRLNYSGPKPLFKVYNKPMIDYLIDSFLELETVDLLTVVGHKKDKVIAHIEGRSKYVSQNNQLGTGHAALQCIDYIEQYKNTFIVMGDAPFVSSISLKNMLQKHSKSNSDCTFLYSKFPIKLPYGRLLFNEDGRVKRVVEEHNADAEIKKEQNYFTSQYLFKSKILIETLKKIKPDPKTKEYNLTDTINILSNDHRKLSSMFIENYRQLIGINSVDDLSFIGRLNEYK